MRAFTGVTLKTGPEKQDTGINGCDVYSAEGTVVKGTNFVGLTVDGKHMEDTENAKMIPTENVEMIPNENGELVSSENAQMVPTGNSCENIPSEIDMAGNEGYLSLMDGFKQLKSELQYEFIAWCKAFKNCD